VQTIPVRADGGVDDAALEAMIDERVRLVSLTWLPANGGLINDAAAIGRIARKFDIPYFIDAAQALGQLPVDVSELGCDVLKGAGRKYLRGPRGTAILYVRQAFLDRLSPSFLDVLSGPWSGSGAQVRPDSRRFETSEGSVALQLGLGAALKQAKALGIGAIRTRIDGLARQVRSGLGAIPGVTIRDLGSEHSGLVSFTLDGVPAQTIRAELARQRIAISANGVAYTPLDMTARGLDSIARASVSYYNTPEEIHRLCEAVANLSRQGSSRPL
jgi:selenocysteine lyase/cysteine desulfurase